MSAGWKKKMHRSNPTGRGYVDNRGVTMVETLVAFTVLMIVLGIIYGILSVCNTLRMRAQDTNQAVIDFGREMYNNQNTEGVNQEHHISIKPYVTEDNQPLFYLAVSNETSKDNFGEAGEGYWKTINPNLENASQDMIDSSNQEIQKLWLSMYNIEAVTYVYLPDSDVKASRIIVPSAVKFIHKEDR